MTQTGNNYVKYSDAFFITASSFSDTGLVTLDTYNTWNWFGQAVIAILIFIGGLGIFALKIFIINVIFMKRKTSMSDLQLVGHERAGRDDNSTKKIIRDSIGLLLIIFILFSIALSIYFYNVDPKEISSDSSITGKYISPKGDWGTSFRYGIFHCISALNNAGFDIIGENSLMPYYHNIGLQVMFLILFIIGGVGYPAIHDFLNWIRFKVKNGRRPYRWKLFTKISVSTYLIVTVIGFTLILGFELGKNNIDSFWHQTKYGGNGAYKIWALIFTTFSSRSAGFATIPMNNLSGGSIFILTALMFIGAAPASTGGGIRTTTFGILIISIFSKMIGHPSVRAFKRKVDDEIVKMSALVFIISIIIISIIAFISISSLQSYAGDVDDTKLGFLEIMFEASSAFGTTGLSTGVTKGLNVASKIAFAILMFIGQFGISSTILFWGNKRNYSYTYDYIAEDIAIG
ncbi:TrkH family potassium uptake protein [Mycoplasma sp. Mirounga ES2805-ORL]|nr:TrkH family potassium uptake protein [Mycoplasma sp. Mirounga ES2805-ORL]